MIKLPRGTEDILPKEAIKWEYVENKVREICKAYNYGEIRTPVFENTELYLRGVGDTTDIVQKEMYTFMDRGGRSNTLRPEGTAGVVRSFIENKLYGEVIQPVKLFYFAQMFRYERPEKGRLRQLNQFGVEVFGSESISLDAEVIGMGNQIFNKLGLKNVRLVINSLGKKEDRQKHRKKLGEYFEPYKKELCRDCQNRLESNPLRILDCKNEEGNKIIKEAPVLLEYLDESSKVNFEELKKLLSSMGIEYEVDTSLVRGLDYYNDTVFEFKVDDVEGKDLTLLGGGRYSGLVKELGGPKTEGIGFGMGIERLLIALEKEGITGEDKKGIDLYVVTVGEEAEIESVRVVQELREQGINVDKDYQGRKLKGQFKAAERNNARYTVVIGNDEIESGIVKLKGKGLVEPIELNIDNLGDKLLELKNKNERGI